TGLIAFLFFNLSSCLILVIRARSPRIEDPRPILPMPNIRFTLSYDGSDFAGWQTQPGQRTVQEVLDAAVARVTQDERVRVNASGRTAAGVHAVGQVVNFPPASRLAPDVLLRAVNAHLPPDVVVRDAAEVPPEFDANRDAARKLYRYVIHDGPVP